MNLQQDIALERLALAKGIELAAEGGRLHGRCPVAPHDEPTLVIDPKANTWLCSAGCGSGGVIEFIAKVDGISLEEAEASLRAEFDPESEAEPVGALDMPGQPDSVLLGLVLGFYRKSLLETPQALSWLQEHALRDPELLTHFGLGYSNRKLGLSLPLGAVKAGRLIRSQLKQLGVLNPSGHEKFRGSITVPIRDLRGRVVQVFGHKTGRDLRAGSRIESWMVEGTFGVVNPEGFVNNQKIIITDGIMDALTWWSAGHRNVTSLMGNAALPTDLKALLVTKSIKGVCLALPRDVESEPLADELRELGIEVSQVVFPKGKDANTIARKSKAPKEALTALLRAANWLSGTGPRPAAEVPPAAAPEPTAPTSENAESDHQVVLVYGNRRWRVRGLETNLSHGSLRVNLMVAKGEAAAFHVDVIELYSARHRRGFLKAAAEELDVEPKVLKSDLGKVLLHLEGVQDERIRQVLEGETPKNPEMDADERDAALAYLKDPRLLDRILDDFETLGVVGERDNKIVAYLAATSRKLKNPLAIVIQSSSAAGKSSLMDAVLKFFPEEEQMSFSAMTGRSLYYLKEGSLAHKILAIAEEEGVGQASYALKLLQSEGKLTIASTAKETTTGKLSTQTYQVSGPVALMTTTTALDVDPELLNRCIVLSVDEGREQTQAIHVAQRLRKTLDGLLQATRQDQLINLHHNVQRLLKPLHVVIPQAADLTYASHALRARRDHGKYLALIQAVALLRQHQRDVLEADLDGIRITYIEATDDDVETASRLAHRVLGSSLDELPPGTRKLLVALHGYVTELAAKQGLDLCDVRFTRRELREGLQVGHTQLRLHLARLLEFEYLVVHRGGQGRRFAYELVFAGEGADGEPFVPGLTTTIPTWRGQEGNLAGRVRPDSGPVAARVRGAENGPKATASQASSGSGSSTAKEGSIGTQKNEGDHSRTAGSH